MAYIASPTPTPLVPVNEATSGVSLAEVFDFISSLLSSLAWPLTVLVILFVFRGAIVKLVDSLKERMPSIEHVKTPWLEAAWSSQAVAEIAEEAGASAPEESAGLGLGDEDVAVQLARVKPSAGVIEAFTDVERQLVRYLAAVEADPRRSPVHAFSREQNAPQHLKHLVRELAALRNAAAHGQGDITESSAMAYIHTARKVANDIKQLVDDREMDTR